MKGTVSGRQGKSPGDSDFPRTPLIGQGAAAPWIPEGFDGRILKSIFQKPKAFGFIKPKGFIYFHFFIEKKASSPG